jgi:hypothetical protein
MKNNNFLILRFAKDKAQALILVFMVIVFAMILLSPMLSKSISERYILRRQQLHNEAFYLAEGGMENAIKSFNDAIANYIISSNVSRYPVDPTNSTFINTTFSNASGVFPNGATVYSYIAEANATESGWDFTMEGGTKVYNKVYIVNSNATHPVTNDISVTLKRVIVRKLTPAYYYDAFYNDDLEIIPGANMTFSGKFHTNGNMYLACDGSGKILTIDSQYLYSSGSVYNRRKENNNTMLGDVNIRQFGNSSYMEMNGFDSRNATWTVDSQTTDWWNGTVKDSSHGITASSAPVIQSIQPSGYYANATLINGTKIENGVIRESSVVLVEGVNIPNGTIVTDTDFYNNREGRYVRMTNINLRKLANLDNLTCSSGNSTYVCPNHMPPNGLLYATRNDTSGSEQAGIRVVNGSEIGRPGGFTLVSNDPVYIQGDYNTIDKKPAAIICDSVNLLSNSWNDSNINWTARTASATTINSAFVAGIVQSNNATGVYSGGLENYPRLHENWSGKNLTIKGSFIELWNSSVSTGNWVYGSPYYSAPNRKWSYDSDFTSAGGLPPFTPIAVSARRGPWWEE